MNSPHMRVVSFLPLGILAALVIGLTSCGTDTGPTEPAGPERTEASADRTTLSFWAPGAPTAKIAGGNRAQGDELKAAQKRADDAREAAQVAARAAAKAQDRDEKAQKAVERAAEQLARAEAQDGHERAREKARAAWREALDAAGDAARAAREARQEADAAAAGADEADTILAKIVTQGEEDDPGAGEEGDTEEELDDPGRVIYTAPAGEWSVVGVIGPRGGKLIVADDGGTRSPDDDVYVSLTIPARAQLTPQEITMAVIGAGALSTLKVEFEPTDTEFAKDAKLTVRMGKSRVDVDVKSGQIKVEHETIIETTYVQAKVSKSKSGTVTLTVKVPGFSVYSLGGGR